MEKLSEHITIDRVKANPATNLMQLFDHGMSGEELYDAFIDRIKDWVLKIDVHVATLATILLNTPNLPLLPHTLYLEIAEAVDTVLPNHPLYIRSAVYVDLVEVVHRHSQTQFEKTATERFLKTSDILDAVKNAAKSIKPDNSTDPNLN